MPFIVKQNLFRPNQLISNVHPKPYSFRGEINVPLLNKILIDILNEMPIEKDEVIQTFDSMYPDFLAQKEVDNTKYENDLASIPEVFKFFSILYTQYETAHDKALRLYLNLIASEEVNLSMPYFYDFIPIIHIKQLNNNPYSELDPLDDPKIKWKIIVENFVKRRWYNFLHKGIINFTFID